MTVLSVNVNKIALLRNSRGSNYPDLLYFVQRLVDLGVKGVTVHPRPDERHITRKDVHAIAEFLRPYPDVEFNIEGYPSAAFMRLIDTIRPAQCTLVPDEPGQLTSDHGWDAGVHAGFLQPVLEQLRDQGVRSSLFLDPDVAMVEQAARLSLDRIELYTEDYARAYGGEREAAVWQQYHDAASHAVASGLGLNAGHDLNLRNLKRFLEIPDILEVSIGHALIVESLEQGFDAVVKQYQAIAGA